MPGTMLFHRSVRTLLFSSVFVCIFAPIPIAQNLPPADTPSSVADVQKRVDAIEHLMLDERLKRVEDKIPESSIALANIKSDLYNFAMTNFWVMFGTIVAIFALMGIAAAYALNQLLEQRMVAHGEQILASVDQRGAKILTNVDQRVTKLIDEKIKAAETMTLAEIFSSLSYTYYRIYSYNFESTQQHPRTTPAADYRIRIMTEANIAKVFAEMGLHALSEVKPEDTRNPSRWYYLEANLVNYELYNHAVELICKRETGDELDGGVINLLLDRSERCLFIANGKQVSHDTIWVEMHDSVAFAWVRFGDGQISARGRGLIEAICAGTKPSPAHVPAGAEQIARLKKEYNI